MYSILVIPYITSMMDESVKQGLYYFIILQLWVEEEKKGRITRERVRISSEQGQHGPQD